MDARERTAYHEAGHFVVAMLRPCPALHITAVTIRENDRYAGMVTHQLPRRLFASEVWALCGILVAGYEAETRAAGAPAPKNAATDLKQVRQWLGDLAEPGVVASDPESLVSLSRKLHREIRQLLAEQWPRVERLAHALQQHEHLSARDARQVVIPPPAKPG
ncbi:MAG: hypothetical protein ACPG4T_10100 [Nannocystaceae bacterium]